MTQNFEIFSRLPGHWSFTRTLSNFKEPLSSGIVTGNASFTPTDDPTHILHYKETGLFKSNSTEHTIYNEYFFVFNEKTKNIEKHFAQNGIKTGLFYIIDAQHNGNHICVNDHYAASYAFIDECFKEFSLTYKVTGPLKDYVSETKYTLA